MTLRPEPVTSKFRSLYLNETYPIFLNPEIYDSTSSAGSTASLTSILHRNNDEKVDIISNNNYSEDLSIDHGNLNCSFREELLEQSKVAQCNFTFNKYDLKTKNHNGIIREIMHFKDTGIDSNFSNEYRNRRFRNERSCKRIIARKPDYPGSRTTLVSYPNVLQERHLSKIVTKSKIKNNNNDSKTEISKRKIKELRNGTKTFDDDNFKTETLKRNSNGVVDEIVVNDNSAKNQSERSDNNYTCKSDFTSVSEQLEEHEQSSKHKKADIVDNSSSINENDSFTTNHALSVTDTDSVDGKQPPQRMLTAWENWFLRKEKEERKRHKKERLKTLREEQKKKEDELNRERRRDMCQRKINDWLNLKEQERLKAIAKQKEAKQKAEENSSKKEDNLKKSSEKYVAWKLKKMQLEKEEKRQEKEKLEKLEAEKMIKQAKAKNAFNHWLEEHRDHHLPVSYSYGISDGKLTSYYDKTSNPPPSYFNPKPWAPIIEIKQ